MGYYSPSIQDIKVTTSLKHKKDCAPTGYIFFIAKVKHGDKIYSIHKLAYRRTATVEQENNFVQAMKKALIDQIVAKNKAN